jgi:hypothetical protein
MRTASTADALEVSMQEVVMHMYSQDSFQVTAAVATAVEYQQLSIVE